MNGQTNFYTVKKGDALWKIAKENGTSVESLKKINGLKTVNKIAVGQRIALRPEAVCGVEALFLDRDRNPIKDLLYRIERCGKISNGTTGESGKTKSLLTETPDDLVKIWVKRLDGSWKLVTTVVSGFGNKLVTLISGHMMVQATTEKHPNLAPNTKPNPRERQKPLHDKPPVPTTDKKELGLKVTPVKTLNGKPLTKVEGDIPGLDFLGGYTGEKITDADYEAAAKELGCEIEIIKAIEKVESGGRTGFDVKNRPVILYERHVFSRNTKRKYDDIYPDISAKKGYKLKKKSDIVSAADLAMEYYAASSDVNYRRLAKAYQLDKGAALKACSWGRFQVLGENFKDIGFDSPRAMVDAHVRGAKGHLQAFIGFIKSKRLQKAMKEKDWVAIAKGYNGKGYAKFKYDERIKNAYLLLKK